MQPVVRSLRILRRVAREPQGMTLQELSEREGIPLASVHRTLAVLAEEQFITRSAATKRYFAGPAVNELVRLPTSPRSTRVVHPEVAKVADLTGDSTFVTELSGSRAVCVSLVEGRRPLHLFVQVGQEMPLHAAASARVLLAGLPEGEVNALMIEQPMTRFTAQTPISPADLLDRLELIRERGYDICEGELDEDAWAVSAPIKLGDRTVSSLTVAHPLSRTPEPALADRLIALVRNAAEKIQPV